VRACSSLTVVITLFNIRRIMSRRLLQLLCVFFLVVTACFSQTFTDGPSAVTNADGRLEIFARASDGSVWHNWQTTPGSSWNGWSELGGVIAGAPTVAVNYDGRLELFVVGENQIAYHNFQTSPGGSWSGWSSLGGSIATPPSVTTNVDGRLQIFAQGTDNAAWTAYQQTPGGSFSNWVSLGGYIIGSPSAAQNIDGRLEIFVLGGGHSAYHQWQTSPGGTWSGWSSLGGSITSTPNVGMNYDGRLEIFAVGTDSTAWDSYQTTPGGSWSEWASLGGYISTAPSIQMDLAKGSLDTFSLSYGQQPWVSNQNTGWGWSALGGELTNSPGIGLNFDARLELFGIGVDGNVWHNWQESSGGSWSGWAPISTDAPFYPQTCQYGAVFDESNFLPADGSGPYLFGSFCALVGAFDPPPPPPPTSEQRPPLPVCTITVYFRNLNFTGGSFAGHGFLTFYRSDTQKTRFIEGYPDSNRMLKAWDSSQGLPGDIPTILGKGNRYGGVTGTAVCGEELTLDAALDQINAANIHYDPRGPNSNSVWRFMIAHVPGLQTALPAGFPPFKAFGYYTKLPGVE
jgi:hypothetical protein